MKELVVLIVKYLRKELAQHSLNSDSAEGVEVAVQCLENAYSVSSEDVECCTISLEDLYLAASYSAETTSVHFRSQEDKVATDDQQEEAETLKLMGNRLMKDLHYPDAIGYYTRAINLDPKNPVYFCNRAAGHIQMQNYLAAINDCYEAIRLDPNYSKAHSRLGFAYQAVGNRAKAKDCYAKALELEPENESYRNCYHKLVEPGTSPRPVSELMGLLPGIDVSAIMKNPSFMQMASQMLEDPTMQNVVSRILSGQSSFPVGQVEELISAGQLLADRIQSQMERQQGDGASSRQQQVSAPSDSEGAPPSVASPPANAAFLGEGGASQSSEGAGEGSRSTGVPGKDGPNDVDMGDGDNAEQ